MFRLAGIAFLALIVCASSADAGIPRTLSYQGILGDSLGNPKPNGSYTLTFKLYTVSSAGTAKWTETKSVTTSSGRFSTVLGDTAPLPDSLRFDNQYYLGIKLSTDLNEMTPRIVLTSAPYSLNAAKAETASVALGSAGSWTLSGSTLSYVGGNVGIGTSSPSSRLEVRDSTPLPVMTIRNNNSNGTGLDVQSYGAGIPVYARAPFGGFAAIAGDAGGLPSYASGIGVRGASTSNYGVAGYSDTIGTYGEGKYGVVGKTTLATGAGVLGVTTASNPNASAVLGTATAGSGVTYGVKGTTASNGWEASGVLGYASSTSGHTYGVQGITASSDYHACGVLGRATAFVGPTVGVYGESVISPIGTGVVGLGTSIGGYFEATSASGWAGIFAGRVQANVLQINGGSDLAEPFETSGEGALEPGTVLVIDDDAAGKLTVSTVAYDRKVAGIISGAGGVKAGITLKQDGLLDGSSLVAIAGRVYCKAEALSGAIRPGDLLTTSAISGHAMKATEYDRAQGAIIGKAMTALDEGTGLVLVLVNLQ